MGYQRAATMRKLLTTIRRTAVAKKIARRAILFDRLPIVESGAKMKGMLHTKQLKLHNGNCLRGNKSLPQL